MKRNRTLILTAITALLILSPAALNAQEEKEKEVEKKIEKKIRIVTVDESGEKTILDTTITGVMIRKLFRSIQREIKKLSAKKVVYM